LHLDLQDITYFYVFFSETKNSPLKTGAFGYDPFQKLGLGLGPDASSPPTKNQAGTTVPRSDLTLNQANSCHPRNGGKIHGSKQTSKKLIVYDILLMLQKSCVHQLKLVVE